jgi:phosphopantetheinyl transferase
MSNIALVYYTRTANIGSFAFKNLHLLNEAELKRLGAISKASDKNLFAASHQIARFAVAEYLKCSVDSVEIQQRCTSCGGPHGKPKIISHEGVEISWSHTERAIVVGVASQPIGVDVEGHTNGFVPTDLNLDKVLSYTEISRFASTLPCGQLSVSLEQFYKIWTYKECLVKLGRLSIDRFNTVTMPDMKLRDLVDMNQHQFIATEGVQPAIFRDQIASIIGCILTSGNIHVKHIGELLD